MLRSLALLLEHGSASRSSRARSTPPSTQRSRDGADAGLGGTATTAEFGDAVLAALEVPAEWRVTQASASAIRAPQGSHSAAASLCSRPDATHEPLAELHRRRRGGRRRPT